MPVTIDHDQRVQPCLVAPTESGRTEDAGVTDAFVPLPPGLQTISLIVGEAQTIRQIIDDKAHPAYEGKEMPTADASVFRKRS